MYIRFGIKIINSKCQYLVKHQLQIQIQILEEGKKLMTFSKSFNGNLYNCFSTRRPLIINKLIILLQGYPWHSTV